MSFISLSDISGCNISKGLLVRRAGALKDRIAIHKRELCRLRGELELRGLAAGAIRLQPQLVSNEIGLLRRSVAKDLRRLARVEALIGQCHEAAEDAVESIDFSIVDPFRGKLISAEERGLGSLGALKRGDAAQKHFGDLPAKHRQKAAEAAKTRLGLGETFEHNEEFVGLDEGEAGYEIRANVVPDVVIAAQAPTEDAWKSNPVIEESGDMADQSPDGGKYDYDGLSGGATHAFDYVMSGNGTGAGTGLADSVDAGGVEPFVDVQSQDFSLDDGGAVSGDLVEPGTIPADTSNVERERVPAAHSREVARRQPSIANAVRFQPGNGPAAMEPMRGPASPNGVPRNGNGGSRLDSHREIMRRQLAGAGMGQVPAPKSSDPSALDFASKLLDTTSALAPGVAQVASGVPATQQQQTRSGQSGQESAASRYMPLIILGGAVILIGGAWWVLSGRNAPPVVQVVSAPKPVSANKKKRRAKKAKAC